MFSAPKSDPLNPRMRLDFKPFTKLSSPPKFKRPNITKLTAITTKHDNMIKLDLSNGFFHV